MPWERVFDIGGVFEKNSTAITEKSGVRNTVIDKYSCSIHQGKIGFLTISGYSQMQSSTCGVFHSLTHWLMWKIEKSSNIEVRTSRHWYVWAHIIIKRAS